MKKMAKDYKDKGLSREDSVKRVIIEIYRERKSNSEKEEKNRINRLKQLTKGRKIEIDNSKGEPIPNDYTMIEAR